MTKIKRRAAAVILLVVLMLAGLGFYIYSYYKDGMMWASFPANQSVYNNGRLSVGTITDRDGEILAKVSNGQRKYSDDSAVRKSTLHVIGDRYGNIGTGALYLFEEELTGFDHINGTYSKEGEGGTVTLSVSAALNAAAYEALNGRKGVVAVCDCVTGEILCMVSSPSFDPDNMPESFEAPQYDGVYINRFLSSVYTPGSVFKLVTIAAAIENIPDLEDRTFICTGSYETGGGDIVCTGYHGEITVDEALAVSCNCVFGQLAEEVGAETLGEYADKYGFTESFAINGVFTESGKYEISDHSYNVAWSGIGQYNDLVNPSAMLRFVSAVANGGYAPELTMLKGDNAADSEYMIKNSTATMLGEMMSYNVYRTYGEERFAGINMHAKSGTAELGGDIAPHSWFVGYGEKDGKTLAFVVVIENGGSGSSAAGNVAATVMQKAFDICG
ncbi:MAG: penicillin-binding protein [Oscillospiraceae bacterium]|nr:penicillin-binding protein [Oscillospiraceae bacterium]